VKYLGILDTNGYFHYVLYDLELFTKLSDRTES